MGARADALAKRFEEATKAVTDILTRLSDADWKKLTGGEKWSVGVVAHHVAMGHAGISNLVKSVASGKSAPSMTRAQLDQMNAQHAKEHAQCTKAETLELHKKNAAHTGFVRSIQKYVFASPAHARLPAARPVGASRMLMRKLRPHFFDIPGNSSTSLERPDIADFSVPTSSAPMWFCAMRSTVPRRRSWPPFDAPPCMIVCAKAR